MKQFVKALVLSLAVAAPVALSIPAVQAAQTHPAAKTSAPSKSVKTNQLKRRQAVKAMKTRMGVSKNHKVARAKKSA